MSKKNLDLLQKQKLELQIQVSNLLNSEFKDNDKINELKSEILYLDKQIEKIIGKKEIERRNELKRKKSGVEEINKNNYYSFKSKVKMINPMTIATNRMLAIIGRLEINHQIEEEKVRVKI